MNKNGFTLIELLAVIVIISMIMLIVYPSIVRIIKDNSDEVYSEYEKMMVEYAMVNPLRTENKILLSELDELDQVKRECTGYVLINHSTPPVYTAYIACSDKYQTNGYDSSLE